MDEALRAQIDAYLPNLHELIRRGRDLEQMLATEPSNATALGANRAWQQDVGVIVNQLSGGSKAHWLARAFSEAFLVRAASGNAVEGVSASEIAGRLVAVLEQAAGSLQAMLTGAIDPMPTATAQAEESAPRRFEFVHNRDLRPVLEQAFKEARQALDGGEYNLALATTCGVLETIVTDALEHKGLAALGSDGAPNGPISEWPFETRLAVAESAGLIRGGWARLPQPARNYRDAAAPESTTAPSVSEQDARRAMQVLHVILRDLDPGR